MPVWWNLLQVPVRSSHIHHKVLQHKACPTSPSSAPFSSIADNSSNPCIKHARSGVQVISTKAHSRCRAASSTMFASLTPIPCHYANFANCCRHQLDRRPASFCFILILEGMLRDYGKCRTDFGKTVRSWSGQILTASPG
jgi:hypothetical protein